MIRMEPNAVRRFFAPIDDFVTLRVFTASEIEGLLRNAKIGSKREYIGLVLNAVVVRYGELVARRGFDPSHEEALLRLCAEVNPALDLAKVVLPVAEPGSIHLLEAGSAALPSPSFDTLRHLEDELARRVVGQPEAIASVSRAVKKSMTGLRDERRPVAVFLFVGQTGVGKTELAKALTLTLYRDPSRLIRIDCSEFALPHEYAKLIGAPPGYIGHDQGGVLTEAMRQSSRGVVLFDEIEKSDPKVHDLLLQITDEGFLTDSKGRRADFHETILVLTSNVGAAELDEWKRRIGFDSGRRVPTRAVVADETMGALREKFKPEFINRLSEVVVFNPIGLDECEQIARTLLDEVRRHAQAVPLTLAWSPTVPRYLAERGFNPDYGAREIRRTVEREVEGPLSDLLVDGKLNVGDRVTVKVRGDKLRFGRN